MGALNEDRDAGDTEDKLPSFLNGIIFSPVNPPFRAVFCYMHSVSTNSAWQRSSPDSGEMADVLFVKICIHFFYLNYVILSYQKLWCDCMGKVGLTALKHQWCIYIWNCMCHIALWRFSLQSQSLHCICVCLSSSTCVTLCCDASM